MNSLIDHKIMCALMSVCRLISEIHMKSKIREYFKVYISVKVQPTSHCVYVGDIILILICQLINLDIY